MKLFLVQHAAAVAKETDPQRPLSTEGQRDMEMLAAFLRRANIRADRVLHSGKRRAEQTAETLAKAITTSGHWGAISGMEPNDAVESFAETIASFSQATVLVGHLPFMSRLVSLLVTGDPARATVAFRPGSVVCLERDPAGGFNISWMLRPELLTAGA